MPYLQDIKSTCQNCGVEYMGDGYQWTCDDCKQKICPTCGSDDCALDWQVFDSAPAWCVECYACSKKTVCFETAKEANESFLRGEFFTPIPGTDHFEEVW